ncbi:MAG: xanthine dehydrogenase family protein molybdopterin-binding subunit [Mesorhizobium sp.]|uniref:xanthine dehydrogenase family protein molybdopterin-binding subunit n=1 Tax=Mesorhizobium sp. TaxID=1871066 RepID=UPI000FE816A0|nr:xanthine dehydrogenase family protein molybdopterin-binding subunit [Mesorhizobium sp.]RWM21928.1 MAG: xanthine dehydrogenase family protein molybdopterin-binding subunit [Mesorhizobium sp.]TIP72733.1 MAG: xanthine dehydrogenase family protein molybdopterin-binding subunit [Mesorhizobium sp.]TIQ11537.1 MAG: xanthine dehydrogenase family protein molybdopterin-binding subunit [Mesorhizobium sp.]TIR48489.1 MAG: xanthine dehydrogenase family protein molybdopterin-binding subunit [Mesorhizobium s
MASVGKIARRTFLIGAGAVASGVAVGYYYYRKPYPNPLEGDLAAGEATFNPYVKIGADNTITIIAPRAEMGQGISTTLAAMVAEELDVDLDQIKVEHGPASYAYYNAAILEEGGPFAFFDESMTAEIVRAGMGVVGKFLALQGTGGSASMRDGFDKMRQAGAAARQMLIAAAAQKLGIAAADLETANGSILHKASGKSLTYGAVAATAATMAPPAEIRLKDKADWKLLGKPQKRIDMLAKVTGAPIFGIDVTLPDLLYGTVKMSPRFWAKPVKADFSKAEKMPGVIKIVPIETNYGHGFGIIAENTWAAFKAAEAIDAEWAGPEYPMDSAGISEALKQALGTKGSVMRDDGDVDIAFADAPREKIVEADYAVPYLAHATMEPMNATARLKDGVLDIWCGNQAPTLVRQLCANAVGIEQDKVSVHTTFMGGGFGRRVEVDYALCAALMAKETAGRPIKVIWTREEDMRHDAYRPASVGKFQARLGEDGMPVAIDMTIASPSLIASTLRRLFPSISPLGPDKSIVDGAYNQPYTIPNYRVTGVAAPVSIPVGSWRSVGSSINGFFHEGFLDEIAAAGKTDAVELRKKLMAAYPAAVKVVEKVAEMAKWGEALPAGKAKGMAFMLSFGSWVGEIVQVADTPSGIRIEKVWIAADVGTALDPGIIEAQLISAAVYGLSAAIGQEITFADGMVEQSNFHDYDAMRIFQCPAFEVAILENFHKMGGVGEVGTPPAAPALANAIFALTSKRIRTLPLSKEVTFA